jgi:hypothetical protein
MLWITNDSELINWNELILWKLSYIQLKILNDIACNLNWIIQFNQFKFLNWIHIQLKKKKCILVEKVLKKFNEFMVLKTKTFEKKLIEKNTFPCHFTWKWAKYIIYNL